MIQDPTAGGRRRNRSRQRERILGFLRSTATHPTASAVHAALHAELPALSLATVYRNLEVLVADGLAARVASAGRAARYDGNVAPHHHFICEECGAIEDVMPAPRRRLPRGLDPRHQARRVRIDLIGCCARCR